MEGGTVGPCHRVHRKRRGTTDSSWVPSLGSVQAGSLRRCFLFNARVRNTGFKKETVFQKAYTNDIKVGENTVYECARRGTCHPRCGPQTTSRYIELFASFNLASRRYCVHQMSIFFHDFFHDYSDWKIHLKWNFDKATWRSILS